MEVKHEKTKMADLIVLSQLMNKNVTCSTAHVLSSACACWMLKLWGKTSQWLKIVPRIYIKHNSLKKKKILCLASYNVFEQLYLSKQFRPRSNCCYRNSLIRISTVCDSTMFNMLAKGSSNVSLNYMQRVKGSIFLKNRHFYQRKV